MYKIFSFTPFVYDFNSNKFYYFLLIIRTSRQSFVFHCTKFYQLIYIILSSSTCICYPFVGDVESVQMKWVLLFGEVLSDLLAPVYSLYWCIVFNKNLGDEFFCSDFLLLMWQNGEQNIVSWKRCCFLFSVFSETVSFLLPFLINSSIWICLTLDS